MAANQAASVATLRNTNNAQATYLSEFGQVGYADTFVKLGPGVPCDSTHACLVDDVLGCATQPCVKSGYKYFMLQRLRQLPSLITVRHPLLRAGPPAVWKIIAA